MYNFDEVIDRSSTNCAKWDGHIEQGKADDLLPLWVADMDFKVLPEIIEDLKQRVEHGVFGYTFVYQEYKDAVIHWMKTRHHIDIESDWIVATPGIVTALKVAVSAYTKEGDAIIIQKPVYYPFDFSIEENNRQVIENPMIFDGKEYHIDYEDFENKIIAHQVKAYILCNPHNPVGKVWKKEELQKVGDICKKHGVLVISDEIHQDFVFGKAKHLPFYAVDESFKEFSILCTSPSKTFNLAGLQVSNIIIANETLRTQFTKRKSRNGVTDPNVLGLVACCSAYTKGHQWCDELVSYVEANIAYTKAFFEQYMPTLKVVPQDGLYLTWVDFRALKMSDQELETCMLEKAKLWLDEGYIFGTGGSGFERFNLAIPRSLLEKALVQLKEALQKEGKI